MFYSNCNTRAFRSVDARMFFLLILALILSACNSDDNNTTIELTCTPPQILSKVGIQCIDLVDPALDDITEVQTYTIGQAITPLPFTNDGGPVQAAGCMVTGSPAALPAGLSLSVSAGTCNIIGTPTMTTLSAQYGIVATNASGSDQANVTIVVNAVSCTPPQVANSAGTACVSPTPIFVPSQNQAAVYYYRPDGNYEGWVLHLWNSVGVCNSYLGDDTVWPAGPAPTAVDPNYGTYWVLPLLEDHSDCANYIIHKGNDKEPNSADQILNLASGTSRWAFAISEGEIFSEPTLPDAVPVTISGASAHWIDEETILWNTTAMDGSDIRLHFSADASLRNLVALGANPSQNQIELTPVAGGQTVAQQALVPHLGAWVAYSHGQDTTTVRRMVGQQLILAAHDSSGAVTRATRVQAAKVLDDLYTSGANDADEQTLGVQYLASDMVSVSVWAPTSRSVKLKVYNASKVLQSTNDMSLTATTGIWTYSAAKATLDRMFYRFEVNVYHPATNRVETIESTDPYSYSLSTSGAYSQFVNLDDADLQPTGWEAHTTPAITNPEDIAIYESHVRDFSIRDATVAIANRGKYLAFTEASSDGIEHLRDLQTAGMNTFHILPSYDYATVNEDVTQQVNLTSTVAQLCAKVSSAPPCSDGTSKSLTLLAVFESYDPTTMADEEKAQALAQSMRGVDGFNWGYDPQHYGVPDGGYATDPDGVKRILEFREMVQALHGLNYRVAFDVVYNHTSSSGTNTNSVLDKVVPGYYHRYNEVNGTIEKSTCCENTATEHRMFDKLMVDTLLTWSKQYRIDAFRFDLMGHSPMASILAAREAVRAIDPDTYFYGEGWNSESEVKNDRQFRQARQDNLAGTEVGTFNDRYRDFIREAALFATAIDNSEIDIIRLGLAGTLSDYMLTNSLGVVRSGSQFSKSSYASDPADIINYVSKHDNETLWDKLQSSSPDSLTNANRVRAFHIASAIPLLSQGVPFLQLGGDIMRSKSLDRNSYDAGDWFNLVDFTLTSNNWNVGLPLASDNGSSWGGPDPDDISKLTGIRGDFANNNIAPTSANITRAGQVFREFLQIRFSSPLFRLTEGAQSLARIGFHNTGGSQTSGLIVMSIDDGMGQTDLDPALDAIVVAINGTATSQSHTVSTATGFALHSVQQSSMDPIVRTAAFTAGTGEGTFMVPAYTMAVFVKAQGANQGLGLSPDPDAVPAPYTEDLEILNATDQSTTALDYSTDGRYFGRVSLAAGTFTFRFVTSAQAAMNFDLGFSDVAVDSNSLTLAAASMANSIALTVTTAGEYEISLDVTTATPTVTVTQTTQIFSCAAITLADSSDPYPFMSPSTGGGDGSLYVRGNHVNRWLTKEKFRLRYKGENRYQAVASFSADIAEPGYDGVDTQFKLASSDGDWSTQLYAQTPSGGIRKSALELDTAHAVEFDDAEMDNNSVSLTLDGTYSFLLTLTAANPSKGTSMVGNLLIQQCQ